MHPPQGPELAARSGYANGPVAGLALQQRARVWEPACPTQAQPVLSQALSKVACKGQ